jgi:hypothetical protein
MGNIFNKEPESSIIKLAVQNFGSGNETTAANYVETHYKPLGSVFCAAEKLANELDLHKTFGVTNEIGDIDQASLAVAKHFLRGDNAPPPENEIEISDSNRQRT